MITISIKMIIIGILIIIISIYFMKQKSKLYSLSYKNGANNVYDIAYRLGVDYLDTLDVYPNYGVMFDIDDTFISSKKYKPIKPIIKLMKECNRRNILVLIITARDSRYTKETIEELNSNGIYSKHDNFYGIPRGAIFYDFLYLRKDPQDNDNQFKSRVKERLAKQNGIITVMSIGDNEVDVNGKYSGYSIKLPNLTDPRLFHNDTYGNFVEVK